MGLFSKKEQGQINEQRFADVEMILKGLEEKHANDTKEVHDALNILDEDLLEIKKDVAVTPQKIAQLETMVKDTIKIVDDLKIFGRVAVQLKEEVEELRNILANNNFSLHRPISERNEKQQTPTDKTKLEEKIRHASEEAHMLETS